MRITMDPPSDKDWKQLYPDLLDYLDNKVYYKVDGYGMTYLNAMDQAFHEYGIEGIRIQLLYIASNIKRGNKEIEDTLTTWSKKIKSDLANRS
jgi:predicted AlkP superfamily pyrophosphatase or phosphodiesterase